MSAVSVSRFFLSCSGAVQLAIVGLALLAAQPGWAQDGERHVKSVTVSNARRENPSVAQTGKDADTIRRNLKDITLPPGFKIELYALVPGARHMALAPSSNLLFVGSRHSTVWVVADRNNDGAADLVKPFANAANFELPNGVCWTKDGALIVVELNRVLRFPAAQTAYDAEQVAVIEVVPQGQLIPPAEESPGHGARTCRVAPDGKLYITLGQPYNVQPAEKIALYEKLGIGGVIRINALDGSAREVVARGLRNPVGIEVASDGVIWTTDNQTDGMGDDTPPGKLSRHTQFGAHHGYPWVIGSVNIPDAVAGYALSQIPPPKHIQPPQLELPAHAADLGLTQYNASAFPKQYRGAFFIAERGSWNRTKPIGARVMVAYTKPDGTADKLEPFAYGWLDEKTGSYRGRPVDVAIMKDGSMLISDDHAGAIYRVTYR